MYSFGYFPGVRLWFADVSEPSISSIFKGWMLLHTLHPVLEDGTDRGFRNVGKLQSDAGEIHKRIHTRFKTRRKFEIKDIKVIHWHLIHSTTFSNMWTIRHAIFLWR